MAMDKKLIDSISNFASALEQLVEELKTQDQEKEKTRSTFAGIFGKKGITKTMKRVEEGIKDIKNDTTEIIKNQKKLIGLNKIKRREENKNVVGESGEKGQMDKIKAGVGSIILIAAAVLAIGMAFKIISPVDVISVLALSFAITLLGFTLARLKKVGVPSAKESFLIGLSLLSFTTAIVATSWLLKLMADVSMSQLGVFGAILGTFTLLSFGMKTLMKSTKDMKPKQLLHLPLILVGISMAIVASSWILALAHNISPNSLLNILLVGGTLGLIALVMTAPIYALNKMGKGVIKSIFLSMTLFPAIAFGIVSSSWILALAHYISPNSLLNILLVGGTLGLVALVMTAPLYALNKMGKGVIKSAFLAMAVLPALAIGIVSSSWILALAHYISPAKLANILLIGLTMSLVALVMTVPLYALNKMGKGVIKSAFLAMVVLPALAIGIVSSSWILALAHYISPAKLANILLIGLTMSLVALVMTVPLYALNKMGKGVIKSAFLAMVVLPALAMGIMLSSFILSKVTTIPPKKLLNILMVGMTMGLVALIMTVPLVALNKFGKSVLKSAFLAVILLPALALGIVLSSHVLKKISDVKPMDLLNAVLVGAAMAVISTLMLIPILVMGKYAGKMLKGALVAVVALPLISLGLAFSSMALSLGNYSKPLPFKYVLSFSLAMLLLVIPVYILGKMGIFSVTFGALGLVLVAWAIAKASRILAGANPLGFKKMSDAFAYFMKVTGPYVKEFMEVTIPLIAKGIGLLITSVLPPLKTFIGAVLPMIQNFITGLINGLIPMVNTLKGVITGIVDSVGGLFRSIGTMVEKVSAGLPAIKESLAALGDAISKPFEMMNKIVNSVANGIVNIIDKVIEAVTKLSQMDPNKLKNVGLSLKVIGEGVSALTGGVMNTLGNIAGGAVDGVKSLFGGGASVTELPITKLLRSISEYGDGVDKVADGLGRLPNIMKNINAFDGNSFETLINGVNNLSDIDDANLGKVLNVLERLDKLKSSSGNIETSNRETVEIEGLKNITEPKNEKILEQLKAMNGHLANLSTINTTISTNLTGIRNDDDDCVLGFNKNNL